MRFRPRTLAARVALVCACAVALAGATVGLSVVLLAGRIVQHEEDARLADAAGTLGYELGAPRAEPIRVTADEALELAHTGIRIAVFERGRLLAGDRAIRPLAHDGCHSQGALRACATSAGPLLAVAARDASPTHAHRAATGQAALVAVLLTTLVGGLASLLLARVAVKPLLRLRDAVNRVPDTDPGSADLGAHERVAEVDALRSSLASALARLGAALAQSRRFASDAAHELRTPVTSIQGELELAAEQIGEAGSQELARARKVAVRLAVLIDRLLILAGPGASLDLVSELDLHEVVEDALELLPGPARARVQLHGASARVPGDHALLVAMLANALENALKFSDGDVRITLAASSGMARLCVEDDGPGVPSSERAQVFAPFYRGKDKAAAGVPGHGLGLALIAHVVSLHHGEVRFAERARGACLEVLLPLGTGASPG